MYIFYNKIHTIESDPWHSWLERKSSKREVVGMGPIMDKNC